MNEVIVLVPGYARILPSGGWEASSTCSLIRSNEKLVIVDPGTNKELLLQKMQEHNVPAEGVDYVILSHHHTDHFLNVSLFPNAKVVDNEAIYEGDHAEPYKEFLPDTEIQIMPTPGHAATHISLVVQTEQYGTVVIAQDVFWWKEDEEQVIDIEKPDEFAEDIQALKESRKKVLEIADWIIPGHGVMFKNPQR
jgi:glyoxylase-like metal-dependent hydrolase (beta-lactamase superfamily II)